MTDFLPSDAESELDYQGVALPRDASPCACERLAEEVLVASVSGAERWRRRRAEFAPGVRSRSTMVPARKREEKRREAAITERLLRQLAKLRSLVPPIARSSQASVIADALKYKRTLKKEIKILQQALPPQDVSRRQAHGQVEVICRDIGMQIQVQCKKKSGLLVALMEAMDSLGLVFSKVSISCHDSIVVDALSTQSSGRLTDVKSVKKALVDTIVGYTNLNSRKHVQ